MTQYVFKGIIGKGREDNNSIILDDNEPLAKLLEDKLPNKQVSVKYFICNHPETKAVLIEGLIQKLYGNVEVKHYPCYSEYTGYLWTDQNIKIGGHDLIPELEANVGKFLYLEIEVHE